MICIFFILQISSVFSQPAENPFISSENEVDSAAPSSVWEAKGPPDDPESVPIDVHIPLLLIVAVGIIISTKRLNFQ